MVLQLLVLIVALVVMTRIALGHKDVFDHSVDPRVALNGKYYMYDPSLFYMHTKCKFKADSECVHPTALTTSTLSTRGRNSSMTLQGYSRKHTVDFLFIKTLIQLNAGVRPEEADLFVVPVFWSLSLDEACGNHEENIHQMLAVLERLGYYQEGTRNHLVIADTWLFGFYTPKWPLHNFIVGRFEAGLVNEMNVGYASGIAADTALRCQIKDPDALPIHDRKYLASVVGQADTRAAYKTRIDFKDRVDAHHEVPDDMFVYIMTKPDSRIDGDEVMRESVMTVSLPGDTPTTDRLFNAFETLTLIGVLSSSRESLLPLLPYKNAVPWEELLVWIDHDTFMNSPDPFRAIRESLPNRETIDKHYDLMKRYAKDVLWIRKDSTAVFNLLNCAMSKILKWYD